MSVYLENIVVALLVFGGTLFLIVRLVRIWRVVTSTDEKGNLDRCAGCSSCAGCSKCSVCVQNCLPLNDRLDTNADELEAKEAAAPEEASLRPKYVAINIKSSKK